MTLPMMKKKIIYLAVLILFFVMSVLPTLAQRKSKNTTKKEPAKVKKTAAIKPRAKALPKAKPGPKTPEDYARAGFKEIPVQTPPPTTPIQLLPRFRFQITCSENKLVLIRTYDVAEPVLSAPRLFTVDNLSTEEYSILVKDDIASLISTAFIKELKVKLVVYDSIYFSFSKQGIDVDLNRIAKVLQQYLPQFYVQEITILGRTGCESSVIATVRP